MQVSRSRAGVAALTVALTIGCPAARQAEPTASGGLGEPEPRATVDVRPFRDERAWTDEDAGLRVNLPEGWLSRSGEGAALLEARGPDGIDFVLRRWDGSAESLEGIAADRVGWLSEGPYGHVAEIADSPPWVHSRPSGRDDRELELGWHFSVDGRGFSLVATVPRVDFEAGLRRVSEVLDALEPTR